MHKHACECLLEPGPSVVQVPKQLNAASGDDALQLLNDMGTGPLEGLELAARPLCREVGAKQGRSEPTASAVNIVDNQGARLSRGLKLAARAMRKRWLQGRLEVS